MRGLTQRLARERPREIILTFLEIKTATLGKLPASAKRSHSANASKSEQVHGANKAARAAGYRSFLLAGQDRVRFVRD
ncbi:hypothetical protein EHS39_34225 [Ensifer sp. MPMI2T]|nr:hypothetical protein EHS39_34225 [Ensifer sp. MPMI2T]